MAVRFLPTGIFELAGAWAYKGLVLAVRVVPYGSPDLAGSSFASFHRSFESIQIQANLLNT